MSSIRGRTRPVKSGKPLPRYLITLIPSDFGRAFRVEKFAPGEPSPVASYDVCLNGEDSSCECMGYLRWGRCRHINACREMEGGVS